MSLRPGGCERQQRDVASLLDRSSKTTLVGRADPTQPPRHNLSALGDELRQQPVILVVDGVNLLDAELANLLPPEVLALGATGSRRAACRTCRTRSRLATIGGSCWAGSFVSHVSPLLCG